MCCVGQGQEVERQKVREMCEQRLTDGWGSYYTAGKTCHLLPVACLSLPLVSFMAVITERMHGQTAPSEIPFSLIKHMYTQPHTHGLDFTLPQIAEPPAAQTGRGAGRGESHQQKLLVRSAAGPCQSLM